MTALSIAKMMVEAIGISGVEKPLEHRIILAGMRDVEQSFFYSGRDF